jgi:eukaryotic-like serine/threonine-protein kinase
MATQSAQPSQTSSSTVIAAAKQHKWGVAAGVFAVLVVLGAAGLGVYSLLHRPVPTPFQSFTVTKVTNSGKAARAAISPDGRYVVSVMDDKGLQSLWLRNVPTGSDTQVIPPSASHYESLAFSPDGNYIYFLKAPDESAGVYTLYRSPILGGAPQTVVRNIHGDITFSPDRQHIAYFRKNDPEVGKYSLLTASLEGNNETVLQVKSLASEYFSDLAWSPRGDEIFYSLTNGGVLGEAGGINIFDVGTGKSHRFVTFKDKEPHDIRWSPDGRTLFAVFLQAGVNAVRGTQIGFLLATGGDIEPITRGTHGYSSMTVSADGRTLAAVQSRSYATISVLSKAGREFGEPRRLLPQSNEFGDPSSLSWSADGLLLVSNAVRLLKLGADGKSQTQLLADSSGTIDQHSSCGSNYLVLAWARGTTSVNIWRTNADGSSPLKLTDGRKDWFPVCSPDQKWVYYFDWTDFHIHRVPLDGSGKTEAIFGMPQGSAWLWALSVSPDGKTLASLVSGQGAAKIALFSLGSPSPPRMLDASQDSGDVQFTPDGKSVAYLIEENGVGNVRVQPLDGSPGYPITDFKSEQIYSFHLSPDGKSLGIVRGHDDSDVVLLQESKP